MQILQRQPKNIQEALMIRDNYVMAWKPTRDVWPFVFGDDLVGCINIFGGLFITHLFRRELKLLHFARVTSYMPTIGLPTVGCYVFQSTVISTDMIQMNSCPLCIQTKSSLAQVAFGYFPLVIAPVVCFYLADRLLTYPVPPLVKAPREAFQLFRKIIKKSHRSFMILGAVHFVASWFVSYEKLNSLEKIGYFSKGN